MHDAFFEGIFCFRFHIMQSNYMKPNLRFLQRAFLMSKYKIISVADDLGADDMGFNNDKQINTPTFDAMHDQVLCV